jgi:uncharacterized membrane protein
MPDSVSMPSSGAPRRVVRAGFLLGFAMGGFFDGILLHQVLQWHHLLSLVDSPLVQDIRVQILADGLFHLLMYLVAAAGMILLWRARRELAGRDEDGRLFAGVLFGFGAWHVTDAVAFHWVLQIHHVRVDSAHPLLWDLGWVAVFGIAFLIAGWKMRRSTGGRGGPVPGTTAVALLITVAGIAAGMPPATPQADIVLFRPGTSARQVFEALDAVDARILWADRSGGVWAVRFGKPVSARTAQAATLLRHGALLVSGQVLPLGCLSWSKI